MLILILACTIPLILMAVGDVLDRKKRKKLGTIIGFTGFGLFCIIVVCVAIFLFI